MTRVDPAGFRVGSGSRVSDPGRVSGQGSHVMTRPGRPGSTRPGHDPGRPGSDPAGSRVWGPRPGSGSGSGNPGHDPPGLDPGRPAGHDPGPGRLNSVKLNLIEFNSSNYGRITTEFWVDPAGSPGSRPGSGSGSRD